MKNSNQNQESSLPFRCLQEAQSRLNEIEAMAAGDPERLRYWTLMQLNGLLMELALSRKEYMFTGSLEDEHKSF